MRTPIVPITVAFIVGISLFANAASAPLVIAIIAGLSAVAAIQRRQRGYWSIAALMILWGSLGALRMAVWEAHQEARLKEFLSDEPEHVRLHGVVIDDPLERTRTYGVGSKRQATSDNRPATRNPEQICTLSLRHVRLDEGWRAVRGRLRAAIDDSRRLLRYGDEVLVSGRWSIVASPGNPGQYDRRASLARERIYGVLRVSSFDGMRILRRGQGSSWLAWASAVRRRWEGILRAHFDPLHEGFLRALLLGERGVLDDGLRSAFVETGTIHLLVISGFHVGIIALALEWLLRLIGAPWRLRLVLVAIALGGYAILVGMQPPVVRATVMAWIVLYAYAMDRVINWPNVLAAAALVLLWFKPCELFDPGFQLSFGAVLSLIILARRWRIWIDQGLSWLRPAWLRRYLAISLSATSAVWVGLAPVLAWYFHLLVPVAILANVVVAPLVSAIVALGTLLLILESAFGGLVSWGYGLLVLLLDSVLRAVAFCRAIPGAHFHVIHPSVLFLIEYYLLLAVSAFRLQLGFRVKRVLGLWLAAIVITLWSLVAEAAAASRWLRVDVLDVGHGDSIVVRMPSGRSMIIDTGTEDAGRYRLIPFLRHEGVERIDTLILTHQDADHIGGAIPVLEQFHVRQLLTSGVWDDTISVRRLWQLAALHGARRALLTAGMRLEGEPYVKLEVIHPPVGFDDGPGVTSNDATIVLKVSMGEVGMLFSGDIEEKGIAWLLHTGVSLNATVLKVPHHGSRLGAVGGRFFEAVNPAVAILSVGKAHNLPAPETIQAIESTGARLYMTRNDGAIRMRTDGERLFVERTKHKL